MTPEIEALDIQIEYLKEKRWILVVNYKNEALNKLLPLTIEKAVNADYVCFEHDGGYKELVKLMSAYKTVTSSGYRPSNKKMALK